MYVNWGEWIEKIHPVRAALALASVISTIVMIFKGIVIPDAWWVIVTGLALFYVESFKK